MRINNCTVVLSLLLLISQQALATTSESPIRGQVIEEESRKPILGVIVVARWMETESVFPESRTYCAHVESVTTDSDGRYQLPQHKGRGPTLINTYKPGYGPSAESQRTERSRPNVLAPFTGTRSERLEYLKHTSSALTCSNPGASERNLLPIRRALLEEAKQLVGADYNKDVIEPFLFQVEMIELGYDVAERRQVERLRGMK